MVFPDWKGIDFDYKYNNLGSTIKKHYCPVKLRNNKKSLFTLLNGVHYLKFEKQAPHLPSSIADWARCYSPFFYCFL